MARSINFGKWALLAGLVSFILLFFALGWHHYLTFAALAENWVALKSYIEQNYIQSIFLYSLVYIAVVAALFVPGAALLTMAGGLLFGLWIGTSLTVVSATLGALIVFGIAKTTLGELVASKIGPSIEKLRAGFAENELNYMFFLRLVPLFPFWLINLVPGLIGVRFRSFVISTFFGIIPGSFAFTYLGVGLDTIIEQQMKMRDLCLSKLGAANQKNMQNECHFTFDVKNLITQDMILAFVALAIVALIPVIYKKWARYKEF